MGWHRRSGYRRGSLVKTAMFRYKIIIGRRLLARTLCNQKSEARIGVLSQTFSTSEFAPMGSK